MAGTHLTVEINDAALVAAFDRLAALGANPEPILREFGEILVNSTDARFARQVGPDGVPWEPLKPSTIKSKRRNADKILVASGNLRETLAPQIDGNTLLFGTNRIYGATHQFGGQTRRNAVSRRVNFKVDAATGRSRFAKRKTANFEQWITYGAAGAEIPARPFLGVTDDDKRSFLSILTRHLKGL